MGKFVRLAPVYQTPKSINDKFRALPEIDWTGKRVIDIGCNSGILNLILEAEGVAKYTGIDVSDDYIEEAKKNFPSVDFQVGDVTNWTWGKYDIALSFSTLHILDDIDFEKALKNISENCHELYFEVPTEGVSSLYYTRSVEENVLRARKYFRKARLIGDSPSPHDPNSRRKIFRCVS